MMAIDVPKPDTLDLFNYNIMLSDPDIHSTLISKLDYQLNTNKTVHKNIVA